MIVSELSTIMTGMKVRIRKAAFASLIGWIAGLAVSLPFQATEFIRASGPAAAAYALLLWVVFSFLVSLYFCGFFVIPITWMLPNTLITGHRVVSIAAAGLFGVMLAAIRLHIWTMADHDGISLINFCMWAAFSGAFFLAASTVYTRSLRSGVAL
jgi:hypothetical protein